MSTNEKIRLDITSAFDPGGFVRADKALKGIGQTMNRQGEAVNKVVSAFGEANSEVGKLAKGAQNLMGAFAGGGIWGLAAASVAILASKFMEARESAAKLIEEQKKAWNNNIIQNMEASLSGLRSKHAKIADEIERGAKAADRIAKAYEALAKSEVMASNANSDKQVARLEKERDSKMTGESDPVKRKAIEIGYEQKILGVKAKASEFENSKKVAMAEKNLSEAKNDLEQEKAKLPRLKAREDELQSYLDKSAIEEYAKKNPMPSQEEFNKTIHIGGGAMGVGGGEKAFFDSASYQKAMGDWWSKANEFLKPIEAGRKSAREELEQVRKEISDAPSIIKSKDLIVSSKEQEFTASKDTRDASRDRSDRLNEAVLKNNEELAKTTEDYQKALAERSKVEKLITTKEEEIMRFKEKEKDREEKRNALIQSSAQAKSIGPATWNQQQQDAKDAKETKDKADKKEAQWVANAKSRKATGAKLSEDELFRIENFDKNDADQIDQPNEQKWQDETNTRLQKGFFVSGKDKLRVQKFDELQGDRRRMLDIGKDKDPLLTALEKNLSELEKLNTNLEKSLKVN